MIPLAEMRREPPLHPLAEMRREEAAGLAAYFSEARLSSNVPVDCTKRKNVSKPKGARPGFVIYKKHQTFYVTPKAPEEPDNH
jgi:predicted ribosome quality control (RQC) complex YloA/Tae2 family protein